MTIAIKSRITALEQAVMQAEDVSLSAYKVSQKSDHKKYAFAAGLKNDLQRTRAALRRIIDKYDMCSFGMLFQYTQGQIANLNQVLRNLKRAGEIDFAPECFFAGVHDDVQIRLLDKFWKETYDVDETNVFRSQIMPIDFDRSHRKGRSYEAENAETRHIHVCAACSRHVPDEERITVRCQVFHLSCLTCAVCGASPRQKKDYVTFDGRMCCSSACIQRYDGAHIQQSRN